MKYQGQIVRAAIVVFIVTCGTYFALGYSNGTNSGHIKTWKPKFAREYFFYFTSESSSSQPGLTQFLTILFSSPSNDVRLD